MPADLPPTPYVATLTAEQGANLLCARGALMMANLGDPEAKAQVNNPWTRRYLERLRQSDPMRDWTPLITPLPRGMSYGDFMALINRCSSGQEPEPKAR